MGRPTGRRGYFAFEDLTWSSLSQYGFFIRGKLHGFAAAVGESNFVLGGDGRTQSDARRLTILPIDIDVDRASCMESFNGAGRPGFRQRRQNADLAGMALQQHFRDARRAPEISIDLKWRMSVEHIWKCRFSEQARHVLAGLVAVFETSPEIDDPGAAPSGVS